MKRGHELKGAGGPKDAQTLQGVSNVTKEEIYEELWRSRVPTPSMGLDLVSTWSEKGDHPGPP